MRDINRSRRVINRGPTRVVGKFSSLKVGKAIYWESQLERDRFHFLEFDSSVITFQEQPKPINYKLDGDLRRYTPDLQIWSKRGNRYEEIKMKKEAEKPENIKKFEIVKSVFAEMGWDYRVVTEDTIRVQPCLDNINLILRYQREEITCYQRDIVNERFGTESKTNVFALCSDDGPEQVTIAHIYALISSHALRIDLGTPLTPQSTVFKTEAL